MNVTLDTGGVFAEATAAPSTFLPKAILSTFSTREGFG